jgi:hypothetical protein
MLKTQNKENFAANLRNTNFNARAAIWNLPRSACRVALSATLFNLSALHLQRYRMGQAPEEGLSGTRNFIPLKFVPFTCRQASAKISAMTFPHDWRLDAIHIYKPIQRRIYAT